MNLSRLPSSNNNNNNKFHQLWNHNHSHLNNLKIINSLSNSLSNNHINSHNKINSNLQTNNFISHLNNLNKFNLNQSYSHHNKVFYSLINSKSCYKSTLGIKTTISQIDSNAINLNKKWSQDDVTAIDFWVRFQEILKCKGLIIEGPRNDTANIR